MKVEIWSDIACPFCYIGKAHYEEALSQFKHSSKVETIYRSYLISPDIQFDENETVVTMLMAKKGMSETHVKQMLSQVEQMASEANVKINFSTNKPANTLNAHRLLQFAYSVNKTESVLNALFKAHFELGENIQDTNVLISLAVNCGIDKLVLESLFTSDNFLYEVKQDILYANNIGVKGVPFFLFNNKYTISGAQPTSVFTEVLNKVYEEWSGSMNDKISVSEQSNLSCDNDKCDI
ncbi:MAG: DsbA family oxidoreductase [Bacteroidetes bacterium]|nr:DsbA family oxidoreductase [Bacteroidota bacterium]